jgi:hypothetical protein
MHPADWCTRKKADLLAPVLSGWQLTRNGDELQGGRALLPDLTVGVKFGDGIEVCLGPTLTLPSPA